MSNLTKKLSRAKLESKRASVRSARADDRLAAALGGLDQAAEDIDRMGALVMVQCFELGMAQGQIDRVSAENANLVERVKELETVCRDYETDDPWACP